MSLIRNLVKEPEHNPKKKKAGEEDDGDSLEEDKSLRPIVKSATDLQRLKLEKLMKNPDKVMNIPEARREKDYMQTVPSFVRNVMGSSAGAGSGEFHVYRHLRRKEYARQKTIQAKSMREQLDDEYQQKVEKNRLAAEDKTAKKRAKRQKRKQQRGKRPRQSDNKDVVNIAQSDSSASAEEEEEGAQGDGNDEGEAQAPEQTEDKPADKQQAIAEEPMPPTAEEQTVETTEATAQERPTNDEDAAKGNTETI